MNYCSYVNKLGFDSFDRSGETYCCNSSENNNLTTTKSFAAQEYKPKTTLTVKEAEELLKDKYPEGVEIIDE